MDHAVTSGPFRFVAWVPAQEVRLERNERYYKSGLPKLEKVVLRVTADKASEVNQLLGGAVDYVKKVPLDQTERILRSPDLEIEPFWGRQYNYLTWNTQRPPLDDREIRRALTHSIDRQTIIDTLYGGRAKVSVAAILSSAWAFHDGLEPWAFDRAEAQRLFAAKGFSDGDGDGVLERAGAPFSLELKVNSASPVQLNAATMIQEQLRQVGVELRLRPLEFSTWLEHVTSHDYDVAIGGWSVDTALDVSQAFHSDPAKGDYNFGSYSNPEVDRLIVEANLEVDLEVKRAKLHRLQELLHEDQPYTFLWEIQEVNARNRRVQGSQPNTISSFYNLAEWWVE